MRNIRSVWSQPPGAREQLEAALSDRERVRLAAAVGLFAVVMGAAGFLADLSRGIVGTVGLVLIVFAGIGAVQAVAILTGFLTPGAPRREVKRAEKRD